jgi:hypothetical protein
VTRAHFPPTPRNSVSKYMHGLQLQAPFSRTAGFEAEIG